MPELGGAFGVGGHGRSNWRDSYDQLLKKVEKFGDDIKASPTDRYISILKGKKKFAVLGFTAQRMDIGPKLMRPPEGMSARLSYKCNVAAHLSGKRRRVLPTSSRAPLPGAGLGRQRLRAGCLPR